MIDFDIMCGMKLETRNAQSDTEPTYFYDYLARGFQLFQKKFAPDVKVVYYPCCLTDLSVFEGFPDSRVIHVEMNERAVLSLLQEGLEAYRDNALHYRTSVPADLLVMLNPSIASDRPAINVRMGGYVLCNSYHSTDIEMHRNPEFTLIGAIHDKSHKGESIRVQKGTDEQYFFDEEISYAQLIKETGYIGSLEDESHRELDPSWEPPAKVTVTRRKKKNVVMYIFQRIRNNVVTEQMLIEKDWEAAIEEGRFREVPRGSTTDVSLDEVFKQFNDTDEN